MAEIPSTKEHFSWPELPVMPVGNKLPPRPLKQYFLSVLALLLYVAPFMLGAHFIEPLIQNEALRKLAVACFFFFGGLSIVLIFAATPTLVASLYQKREFKQAESLCRLYLAYVGNFSPYSLEKAFMEGLLAEVLRTQGKFEEAEKYVRVGILTCLHNEAYKKMAPNRYKDEKLKELAKVLEQSECPQTKAMLYETFGSILRNRKMIKQAVEAGKWSVKMLEENMHSTQFNITANRAVSGGRVGEQLKKQVALALASAQYELALSHLDDGSPEAALNLLKKAQKIRQEHTGMPLYQANVYSALGQTYLALNENVKALKSAQEALCLLDKVTLPVEYLARAKALKISGLAQSKLGKETDAKKLAYESDQIRKRWLSPGDPELE